MLELRKGAHQGACRIGGEQVRAAQLDVGRGRRGFSAVDVDPADIALCVAIISIRANHSIAGRNPTQIDVGLVIQGRRQTKVGQPSTRSNRRSVSTRRPPHPSKRCRSDYIGA